MLKAISTCASHGVLTSTFQVHAWFQLLFQPVQAHVFVYNPLNLLNVNWYLQSSNFSDNKICSLISSGSCIPWLLCIPVGLSFRRAWNNICDLPRRCYGAMETCSSHIKVSIPWVLNTWPTIFQYNNYLFVLTIKSPLLWKMKSCLSMKQLICSFFYFFHFVSINASLIETDSWNCISV